MEQVKSNERMRKMLITALGAIVGAIGGYFLYKFVGCRTGACPITANPYISVIWGAVIGALLFAK